MRSIAVSVQAGEAWLIANRLEGNRPRPVSLPHRMRSSTRAWLRCLASSQACCPRAVSVAEAGVAPAVAFFDQVQLGAGVRSFAAHDDAHAFGVVGDHCHGEQAGQLGDRGVLRRVAVTVEPGVSASVCSRG